MNEIVEGLNQFYESLPIKREGYFILHKIVDSNPVVKSQKTYRIQVWFVGKDTKISAFGAQYTGRVVTESEENKVLSLLTTSLTKALLNYISSVKFKELCNDTYSSQ